MNKKLASLSVLVASSLFLGGCALQTASPTASQTPAQAVSEATKFADAIKSGKPTTCTLTKGADTMEYMVKGKLMRVNTNTTTTDDKGVSKTTVGHMINDTTSFYTWSDDTKQGVKMLIPSPVPSSAPTSTTEPKNNTPKLESEADYQNLQDQGYTINCKSGSVDDSVFTPPSDVKFIDPTEMMKQVPSAGVPSQADLKKLQQQYGNTSPGTAPTNNY